MSTPTIHLHIDQLIVDGLPIAPSERGVLGAAVEAELARLLDDAAIGHWRSVEAPALRADAIHVAPTDDARMMGARIAGVVAGSLSGRLGSDARVKASGGVRR